MPSKLSKLIPLFITVVLLASGISAAYAQVASTGKTDRLGSAPAQISALVYEQPVVPNGTLLLSAWLDPDGSNSDQYIWDNFMLQTEGLITEIDWYGVYDPLKFGAGGPVADFTVAIYPSIAAGTEPAIAFPPLVEYQIGGNAGEKPVGTASGGTLYAYAFNLPVPFTATAGVKYWVQIEAFQHGSLPDWCLAAGSGGNGSHFRRTSGAGGDIMYRSAPGDAAFSLIGSVAGFPTSTATPTASSTATATSTPTITSTSTTTKTPTSAPTNTPTTTSTTTATNTATITPTATPTNTPTSLPTGTATITPSVTPSNTSLPVSTRTPTSMPILSTPRRVNGGGEIGSEKENVHITFGFTVSFKAGDPAPKGNLVFQDHTAKLRLKAQSFDLLVVEGNHAKITGEGILDSGKKVKFIVEISTAPDTFLISIPELGGYEVGGALPGGNITIHK